MVGNAFKLFAAGSTQDQWCTATKMKSTRLIADVKRLLCIATNLFGHAKVWEG